MASKSIVKMMSDLKFKRLEGVAVPESILSVAEDRAKFIKEMINKNSHATLSEEIAFSRAKNNEEIKKTSNAYKKGQKRREKLTIAFKQAYKWLPEFTNYFEGCPGVDKIKNIISKEKMETAYKKLKGKGYVTINDKDFDVFYDTDLNKVKEKYKNRTLPAYYLDFLKSLILPLKSRDQYEFILEATDTTRYTSKSVGKETDTAENMEIKAPKENTSYQKAGKYKIDCINAFQNLRLVFFAYLSIISKIYNYKFEKVTENKTTEEQELERNEEKLNSVMSTYEKCISNIKTEIQKHKIYFKCIVKRSDMKKLDQSIDEHRQKLQEIVDEAKNVIFRTETLSYTQGEDQTTYNELQNMLKLINDYINDISENISKGKDEKFKDKYNKVLPLLKENLYNQINQFKSKQFKQNNALTATLNESNEKIKNTMMKEAEKTIKEIEKFEIQFKEQYMQTAKSFARNIIPTTISTAFSIAAIFFPPMAVVGKAIDNFDKAVKETDTTVPNLNNPIR